MSVYDNIDHIFSVESIFVKVDTRNSDISIPDKLIKCHGCNETIDLSANFCGSCKHNLKMQKQQAYEADYEETKRNAKGRTNIDELRFNQEIKRLTVCCNILLNDNSNRADYIKKLNNFKELVSLQCGWTSAYDD